MRKKEKFYCLKCRLSKYKIILLTFACGITAILALLKPEYTESVAKAFILILTEL